MLPHSFVFTAFLLFFASMGSADDTKEAERLKSLRLLLQQEILHDIEGSQRLYKDDPKYKPGETVDAVLDQLKPTAYAPLRRPAPLQLHKWRDQEKVVKALVKALADEDDYLAFNAAQVLALDGRRDDVDILRKTLTGKFALSNSEYERDQAALALLTLGEKLPKMFKWREHPEWEKYTRRE